jgi:hypothetical protein
MKMEYIYNDGGRAASGYRGEAGDCAVRAISIATGIPYKDVYKAINTLGRGERVTHRKRGRSNARTGVYKDCVHQFMASIGWRWVPCMSIGSGCTVHLRDGELPGHKRLVVSLSKHYAAVIHGTLHDTYDCSRHGTRCVYGYWTGIPK